MANISSAGIGSGLNVESIVTQLVALERKPIEQLKTEATKLQTQLSSYGKLQGALAAVRDSAAALTSASPYSATTATSSDATSVSVATGSATLPTSYSVEVLSLASAQSLASATYASPTASVGQGSLHIDLGTWSSTDPPAFTPRAGATAVDISFGAGEDTLEKVRDKINAANAGVTASIVNDTTGSRLVLRSSATGADAGFRIAGDGDLAALGYDPENGVATMALSQSASNASAKVNGLAISSASNTLTNVVEGLTLRLSKVTTVPIDIGVTQDTTAMKTAVTSFVTAYNDLAKLLADQVKYNPDSKVAGTLQGDRTAVALQGQLRALLGGNSAASSVFTRMASIGLDPQADGSIKVSTTKLDAALANLPELKKMLSATSADNTRTGFARRFRDFGDAVLGFDGAMSTRTESLRQRISLNTDRQGVFENRLLVVEKRLRAQYGALDTRMGQLNGLQTYMTQQLAQFNKSIG